jgi:hypothetical protein
MELGGKTFAPRHLPHMFGTLGVNLPHLPHQPNRHHILHMVEKGSILVFKRKKTIFYET